MLNNLKIKVAPHGAVSVANTGTMVLPENLRRFFAVIQNVSDTDMWITFGVQGAVGDGIKLPANGFSYEIDKLNLWQGEVYAIHAAGATKVMNFVDCN